MTVATLAVMVIDTIIDITVNSLLHRVSNKPAQ